MTKDERTAELKTMIDTAKEGFEHYQSNLDILAKNYNCEMDEKLRDDLQRRGKSSIFIPLIPSIALKIYTSIITTYFTNPDFATISPDDPNDAIAVEACEAIQAALRYYEKHKHFNLFPVLSKEILNACVYYAVVIKAYWSGNAPRIDGIKLRDVWFDPTATNLKDCQYIVHRMFITRQQAEKLNKNYKGFSRVNISDLTPSNETSDYNNRQPSKYQLIEMFDIYERIDDQDRWQISTLAGNALLRDAKELKDGLPIFVGYLIPQFVKTLEYDAVEMYGQSPVELVLPLQHEMNQTRNQQLDAIRKGLEPSYLSQLGTGINPYAFLNNNRIVNVGDINHVKEITPPDARQAQGSIGQTQLDAQDVSAVTPYNTGTSGSVGNETATGTAILTQEANQRLSVYTQSLNETLVIPMMTHIVKLIWRYADTRHFAGTRMPRDVDPDLFVHVNTGIGATNPVTRINQTREAIALLTSMGQTEGALKLAKNMLGLLGVNNAGELINEQLTAGDAIPDNNAGEVRTGARRGAGGGGAGAIGTGEQPNMADIPSILSGAISNPAAFNGG
jgi:hypothetical protein